MDDKLVIGKYEFRSRLFVGSSKYANFQLMKEAIEASGADVVTVAIRRVNLDNPDEESMFDYLDRDQITILPNTAGCYTVTEAVRTARLAREVCGTDLIKLEVIGDDKTLYPDIPGLLEAARILLDDGFTVLPYSTDDPVTALKLQDMGCPAVMPLGAPIGSGLGIRNPYNLKIILELLEVPIVVDAGVGVPSDAALAMELGCDAVLMQSAIAGSGDPVAMATAMRYAVEAGRLAHRAGRIPRKLYATASSPMTGLID